MNAIALPSSMKQNINSLI